MENKYDSTVSESREESMMKALAIFEEEQARLEETRKLIRPNLKTGKVLLFKLLRLLTAGGGVTAALLLGAKLSLPTWAICLSAAAIPLALLLLFGKRACIEWILLYQKHAPERLRQSCLFTPSCSEYMRLAIEKYGALRGVAKGIRRLCRCHRPNGGVDLP